METSFINEGSAQEEEKYMDIKHFQVKKNHCHILYIGKLDPLNDGQICLQIKNVKSGARLPEF